MSVEANARTADEDVRNKANDPREWAIKKMQNAYKNLTLLNETFGVPESLLKQELESYDRAVQAFEDQDYDHAAKLAASAGKSAYDKVPEISLTMIGEIESKLASLVPGRRRRVDYLLAEFKKPRPEKSDYFGAARIAGDIWRTFDEEIRQQNIDAEANKDVLAKLRRTPRI